VGIVVFVGVGVRCGVEVVIVPHSLKDRTWLPQSKRPTPGLNLFQVL